MSSREVGDAVAAQIAYYRARAVEYDEVYTDDEVWDQIVGALPVGGDVLELACGSGRWTGLLARRAHSVTAVDASPEMIERARVRTVGHDVRFVVADLFSWVPDGVYDTIFFGFWLSHVPPVLVDRFWNAVARALKPGGQVFFLDTNDIEQDVEDVLPGRPVPVVRRRLRDGSEHTVVKVFQTAMQVEQHLHQLGWNAHVETVQQRFLLGRARRRSAVDRFTAPM